MCNVQKMINNFQPQYTR